MLRSLEKKKEESQRIGQKMIFLRILIFLSIFQIFGAKKKILARKKCGKSDDDEFKPFQFAGNSFFIIYS